MRPVRYNVVSTLDGYIAGPNGEFDWIPHDDTVDFASLFAKVDTVLLGRKSFELTKQPGAPPWPKGTRVYVFSTTLKPEQCPGATLVTADAPRVVDGLRHENGTGEIWLFGGGVLFQGLVAAGQVDRMEITIAPVLLGGGIPLLPPGIPRTKLTLTDTRRYPTGMVTLSYAVQNARP